MLLPVAPASAWKLLTDLLILVKVSFVSLIFFDVAFTAAATLRVKKQKRFLTFEKSFLYALVVHIWRIDSFLAPESNLFLFCNICLYIHSSINIIKRILLCSPEANDEPATLVACLFPSSSTSSQGSKTKEKKSLLVYYSRWLKAFVVASCSVDKNTQRKIFFADMCSPALHNLLFHHSLLT